MTRIVKLGGSVITNKTSVETLNLTAIDQAAQSIANTDTSDLIVIHGAGSYGHHHADRYSVTRTAGTTNAVEAWEIHDSMRKLNHNMLTAFHDHDLPALPIHPLSIGVRSSSSELILPSTPFRAMLDELFIPVSHGDVITHTEHGATILSGDELTCHLTIELNADRVGFCTNTPGVLDETGTPVERITDYDTVSRILTGSDGTDVTGGMAAKVKTLLDLNIPATIFGIDQLDLFLHGEFPGTLIDPGSN